MLEEMDWTIIEELVRESDSDELHVIALCSCFSSNTQIHTQINEKNDEEADYCVGFTSVVY